MSASHKLSPLVVTIAEPRAATGAVGPSSPRCTASAAAGRRSPILALPGQVGSTAVCATQRRAVTITAGATTVAAHPLPSPRSRYTIEGSRASSGTPATMAMRSTDVPATGEPSSEPSQAPSSSAAVALDTPIAFETRALHVMGARRAKRVPRAELRLRRAIRLPGLSRPDQAVSVDGRPPFVRGHPLPVRDGKRSLVRRARALASRVLSGPACSRPIAHPPGRSAARTMTNTRSARP